jgi:NDP-sugar pyrophosphorylase family protein
MKIIVPMAGFGQRFVEAGYKEPKPFITVGGKRVIEYICDMFDKENDEFVFICNIKHIQEPHLYQILDKVVNNSKIVAIAPHKLGPVHTVLEAVDHIKEDEPVIISYCDVPAIWDYDAFKEFVRVTDADGCVMSHVGFHPHTLGTTMFAYSKINENSKILEIKEKSCYTDNRFKEHASSGVYYFKYGNYIKNYFRRAIEEKICYNGEYYVTLVYNLLIRDGLNVYSYLDDYVMSFGTPIDIQNYEAWQTIIKGEQVKTHEDLLNCFNYWKMVQEHGKDNNIT